MKPITPIIPGSASPVVIYAKNQPEYNPLPAHRTEDGVVTTRWHLSIIERLRILIGGSIWLSMCTFNHPLQPVKLYTKCPLNKED